MLVHRFLPAAVGKVGPVVLVEAGSVLQRFLGGVEHKALVLRVLAQGAQRHGEQLGADAEQAAKLDNETLITQLTAVRGIGRWTVEMLLMFRLGRPDVLPVDDFGVRKGYMLTFGKKEMPTPRELARYGERWAPYRTVASWYMWRAADIG